jgi:hypothetical protein
MRKAHCTLVAEAADCAVLLKALHCTGYALAMQLARLFCQAVNVVLCCCLPSYPYGISDSVQYYIWFAQAEEMLPEEMATAALKETLSNPKVVPACITSSTAWPKQH